MSADKSVTLNSLEEPCARPVHSFTATLGRIQRIWIERFLDRKNWLSGISCLALWLLTTNANAGTLAYISNESTNTVTVIDVVSQTVVATIPVGLNPQGVAVNSAGTRVYVANGSSRNVSVIDVESNSVVATVPVSGQYPQAVAVTPSGDSIYVTINNPTVGTSTISIINAATNAEVATIPFSGGPQGIAINPSGTRAYVGLFGGNLAVVDIASNSIVATVSLPSGQIGVALNPSGTRAYIANQLQNKVYVMDTGTNTIVSAVSVGAFPRGVAINPSGTRAYITNLNGSSLSVIDTSSNTVLTTFAVGAGPYGIDITPDGRQAYIANSNGNNVSILDLSTNTITGTVPVGVRPIALGKFIAQTPNQTDTTPPEITPIVVGTLGDNGWYRSDVTVGWDVFDGESAISSSSGCVNSSITTDTSGITVTCMATSLGGNSSRSVTVKIDRANPVVPIANHTVFLLNSANSYVAPAAGDVLSGIGSQSCEDAITTSVARELSTACVAQDVAGNRITFSRYYSINYVFKFLAPLEKANSQAYITKGRKLIPFRWRLTDANGAPVTTLASASIGPLLTAGQCPNSNRMREISEYGRGVTKLENYGDGTYSMNYKIATTWTDGFCRYLNLDVGDGALHHAQFRFDP